MNYHQFAHRGLWYGVMMAETAGIELPGALLPRFREGFATPFLVALPDFTLPSRRDSQYAISLRQWRYAESAELGLARGDDARLVGALRRIYADDVAPGDTGRSRSSAEAERNSAPVCLTRADLGWRSLLRARPELPPLRGVETGSVLLEAQGLAILRRDEGRAYVALDYGHSGGGHGHPDRLDLLLARDDTRWLDDPGTGSYVDPSLHWYRSTLAHNAPLVDGRSQPRVHGGLLAWHDVGDAGWVSARLDQIAPGVAVNRTVVAMPAYVVDELVWLAGRDITLDLPLHLAAEARGLTLRRGTLTGEHGLEDGFEFLKDALSADVSAGKVVQLESTSRSGDRLRAWGASDRDAAWWRVTAPGPPGSEPRPFWVVRASGETGVNRFVYAWSDAVADVRLHDRGTSVLFTNGTRHEHRRSPQGWRIEIIERAGTRVLDLAGTAGEAFHIADAPIVPAGSSPARQSVPPRRKPLSLSAGHTLSVQLGERHYIPSEQSWREAGSPTADLALRWEGGDLFVTIDVHVGRRALTFVPAGATNPYDNEPPDVNGDGAQLYLRTPQESAAWMLVPDASSTVVRVRPLAGWASSLTMEAVWHRTSDGYRMEAHVPLGRSRGDKLRIALDVLVNEKPPGRERRRGQLALSGRRHQFVYLRGDRQDPAVLIPFTLVNG